MINVKGGLRTVNLRLDTVNRLKKNRRAGEEWTTKRDQGSGRWRKKWSWSINLMKMWHNLFSTVYNGDRTPDLLRPVLGWLLSDRENDKKDETFIKCFAVLICLQAINSPGNLCPRGLYQVRRILFSSPCVCCFYLKVIHWIRIWVSFPLSAVEFKKRAI